MLFFVRLLGDRAHLRINAIVWLRLAIRLFLEDSFDMLSKSVQAFNDKVAVSLELQAKLRAVTSPMDFLSLAKAEGFDLSGQDFQIVVQQAYQQWIAQLDPKMSSFFSQVRSEKELDNQLKACQSSTDAIALAQQCGVKLSEDDLQQAAMIAETIPGFSFEKLWFRGVGLIK
jgi:predicted ribosomally synthesized peptide with nif11-like leader